MELTIAAALQWAVDQVKQSGSHTAKQSSRHTAEQSSHHTAKQSSHHTAKQSSHHTAKQSSRRPAACPRDPEVVNSENLLPEFSELLLDAEVLLAHVMCVSRSHLYAWPEKKLTDDQQKIFSQLMVRRLQGEPIPYLTGHQEFWSLNFKVTPDTLIPRPETELLVESVLSLFQDEIPDSKKLIADLGTGSGAIALSIAHEKPEWIVYATDMSSAALEVAKWNAQHLKIKNIIFHQGSWCEALPELLFDVIVSNPPYIVENDPHLSQPGLRFEPITALTSGTDGLDAIREIIIEASQYLKPNGYLMLEHGYDQAEKIRKLLEHAGYKNIFSHRDLANIERVTVGVK
jgi:release factor glutamine methyltransferase